MNITYKQFENCYTKAVANLQQMWEAEAITFGFCADDEENVLSYDKEYFYIALDGETVIGYVTGEDKTNSSENYMNVFPMNEAYVQINDLYISPDYRSKNIGAELLAKVEEKADSNGIKHIFLSSATMDSASVRRFYENNGFKIWTTAFFK